MLTLVAIAILAVGAPQTENPKPIGAYTIYNTVIRGDWAELERLKREVPSFKHPIHKSDHSDVLSLLASLTTENHQLQYANALTGIRICIEHGADPNDRSGAPLCIAAAGDAYQKVLIRLLQYGADPNLATPSGTSLYAGIHSKRPKNVEILLAHKADPNKLSGWPKKELPLSLAARMGQADVVSMLLKAGAKVNAKNPSTGRTALHEAAAGRIFPWKLYPEEPYPEEQQVKVIRTLRAGAKKSLKDNRGQTALALARQAKARGAVKALGG